MHDETMRYASELRNSEEKDEIKREQWTKQTNVKRFVTLNLCQAVAVNWIRQFCNSNLPQITDTVFMLVHCANSNAKPKGSIQLKQHGKRFSSVKLNWPTLSQNVMVYTWHGEFTLLFVVYLTTDWIRFTSIYWLIFWDGRDSQWPTRAHAHTHTRFQIQHILSDKSVYFFVFFSLNLWLFLSKPYECRCCLCLMVVDEYTGKHR